MKTWVLTGRTKSGDCVGPFIFEHKPFEGFTEEELEAEFEWDYVHRESVEEIEVIP